ncbi:hypothetical protein BDF14DRAFT_1863084 [Spinellus fusiger]|nr:hypothetical protein BDF14DRAFT_1863084 [Spinellus fusiger]
MAEKDKLEDIQRKVHQLEYMMKLSQSKATMAQHELETEKRNSTVTLDSLTSEIKEAKSRAIYHKQQHEKTQQILTELKQEHTIAVNSLKEQLSELEQNNTLLKQKMHNVQFNVENEKRMLKNSIREATANSVLLENTILSLREQIAYQEQVRVTATEREKDLLLQLEEKSQQTSSTTDDPTTELLLREKFQFSIEEVARVTAENARLVQERDHFKQVYQSNVGLVEEIDSLKRQLVQLTQVQETLIQVEMENAHLKQERKQWNVHLESQTITECQAPQRMAQPTMKENEETLENQSDLPPRLEEDANELTENYVEKNQSLTDDKVGLETLKRGTDLAETTDHDKLKKRRTEDSEEYTKESQVKDTQSINRNPSSTHKEDSNYLIWEVKENPTSQNKAIRQKTLDDLRAENAALLKCLEERSISLENRSNEQSKKRKLEDKSIEMNEDYMEIPKLSLDKLHSSISKLEEEVAIREKRLLRQKEVFENTASRLICAIRHILGYTIEIRDSGQILLESTKVDGSQLTFVVEMKKGEEDVRLIGSVRDIYMEFLRPIYETYVLDRKFLPGFFGSVTTELEVRRPHIETYEPIPEDQEMEIEDEHGMSTEEDLQREDSLIQTKNAHSEEVYQVEEDTQEEDYSQEEEGDYIQGEEEEYSQDEEEEYSQDEEEYSQEEEGDYSHEVGSRLDEPVEYEDQAEYSARHYGAYVFFPKQNDTQVINLDSDDEKQPSILSKNEDTEDLVETGENEDNDDEIDEIDEIEEEIDEIENDSVDGNHSHENLIEPNQETIFFQELLERRYPKDNEETYFHEDTMDSTPATETIYSEDPQEATNDYTISDEDIIEELAIESDELEEEDEEKEGGSSMIDQFDDSYTVEEYSNETNTISIVSTANILSGNSPVVGSLTDDAFIEDNSVERYHREDYLTENMKVEEYSNEDYITEEYVAEEHSNEEYAAEEHSNKEYAAEEHSNEEYAAEEHSNEEYVAEEHSNEECATEEHSSEHYIEDYVNEKHLHTSHSDDSTEHIDNNSVDYSSIENIHTTEQSAEELTSHTSSSESNSDKEKNIAEERHSDDEVAIEPHTLQPQVETSYTGKETVDNEKTE